MKKGIIYALVGIAAIGLTGLAVYEVKAADSNTSYPPIIQKLVDRFKLNADEVKQVFDEQRAENQANMQEKMEERLTKAVTDGKITEAQKNAIIAKEKEIRDKMESFRDLTKEERKTKMTELREEIKSWATTNGIDMKFLPMMGKMHRGGGGMGMGPDGTCPDDAPAESN